MINSKSVARAQDKRKRVNNRADKGEESRFVDIPNLHLNLLDYTYPIKIQWN
jgi:hypothetical protein